MGSGEDLAKEAAAGMAEESELPRSQTRMQAAGRGLNRGRTASVAGDQLCGRVLVSQASRGREWGLA